MGILGAWTFLSPWLLLALLSVPLLLWLLRVMPPRPRSVTIPTFFLIAGLTTDIKSPAKTPWWLLLLRALAVICLVLALADPVLKRNHDLPGSGGTVLIAIDNGWAAAANWPERMRKIGEYLPQLRREGRSVMILPTAADPVDGNLHMAGVMTAEEAETFLARLKPRPWPVDRAAAEKIAAGAMADNKVTYALFFSDGVQDADTGAFIDRLRQGGGLTFFHDTAVNTPVILRRDEEKPGELAFEAERLTSAAALPLVLTAYAAGGNVLDTHAFSIPAGESRVSVQWDVLKEMRSDIARIAVNAPQMASAVVLTDSRWRQHPVGIVSTAGDAENKDFLNEVYYLKRALAVNGAVTTGTPDEILSQPLSAIIWPDSAALTSVERVRLQKWVEEEGGFLVRFAGPNLAANTEDPLLPVPLRHGQRAMQGAMTWEKPVLLGRIPEESPLLGLEVPKDVTVARQVLASPIPEVFEKTWLQLDDGTPLITGGAVGKGVVAMIHTTAGPDWSDFCYSGLYVEALQRMVSLGAGISGYKAQVILPPVSLLDGFGRLVPADAKSIAAPVDPRRPFTPSPATPPGIYGAQEQFQVFNLGNALPRLRAIADVPANVTTESYVLSGERSLKADLLKIFVWLLIVDTVLTLWMRGVLVLPRRRAVAGVFLLLLLVSAPASAQEVDTSDLVSDIYLAFIETGDAATDEISYNGLEALKNVVSSRTNIRIEGVRALDPSHDTLSYYPVIYWPMTEAQSALSVTAARNIQNYLAQGGMILIDTRDQQFAGSDGNLDHSTPGLRQLRKLTENIRIAELAPVGEGHILTKSFYLLDDFPGLYTGGKIWVEKEPSPNFDSVTSIVIGGNDWAAVWSMNPSDRARFRPAPGGERQRELAYRFGVNLLMTALAGSYKADQVHVPYILERIGR